MNNAILFVILLLSFKTFTRATIQRLFLIATVSPFPMTVDPKTLVALYQRNVACNTRNLVWSHLRIYHRPIFPESGSSFNSESTLTMKKESDN